jgi:hypothetical protein
MLNPIDRLRKNWPGCQPHCFVKKALNERANSSRLRSDLAHLKLLVAELRLRLRLNGGFNPDQPRDDRGRWTDTSAGTRLAQAEGSERYSVILAEEEARGGHAIRSHVGKSDAELLATLRRMRTALSLPSSRPTISLTGCSIQTRLLLIWLPAVP